MKNKIILTIGVLATLVQFSSCAKLDLNPLSAASSENWYSNTSEVIMSLNDLYRAYLYPLNNTWFTDRRTDDWAQRDYIYEIAAGTVDSEWSGSQTVWNYTYKGVSRANRVDESLDRLAAAGAVEDEVRILRAEARFFRAFLYSRLITLYGDVPFYTKYITIEEAYTMGRIDKAIILKQIYEDFDYAATYLPVENNGSGVYRVSKGAAYALKARIALAMHDYATASVAAKDCIDLNQYALYPDYGELFRKKTLTCETIFAIANSKALEQSEAIKSWVSRNANGTCTAQPSWELLAAYTCTDGLPIDESPLFDPHNPFLNRDPRCNETFVAHGTEIYGVIFNPRPSATTTLNVKLNLQISNKDNRCVDTYATRNACLLRKGAQPEWSTDLYNENPYLIMRYADVLLMYAEAKIELNDIDQDVLDCINMVRARAYKVDFTKASSYPAITTTDQTALRRILRNERRVEFAWEGRRYFDLLRWGWFKKAFSHNYYGLVSDKAAVQKLEANGNWMWGETPEVDEDGFVDFAPLAAKGLVQVQGERFYDPKIELWPLPNEEVQLSNNVLKNNPGY